jgi:hypothetical protein
MSRSCNTYAACLTIQYSSGCTHSPILLFIEKYAFLTVYYSSDALELLLLFHWHIFMFCLHNFLEVHFCLSAFFIKEVKTQAYESK